MQELKVFKNEEFGSVRVIEIDGEPWFVGKDVASVLGYRNTRDALLKHVDREDKTLDIPIYTRGGKQKLTLINKSGLYSLLLSSRLNSAKRFKHWITSDVLPAIENVVDARKISESISYGQVLDGIANVYVYLIGDCVGNVKIGISSDVERRLGVLNTANPNYLNIFDTFGPFTRDVAELIESHLHELFVDYRIKGEWFLAEPVVDGVRKFFSL